jgi:polysaccharide export outer membrane protein
MRTIILLSAISILTSCAAKHSNVATAPVDSVHVSPPAAEHFVFGPGDVIDIKVWRQPDMDMQIVIAPDGAITYPLVGRIEVSGMTYPELVSTIELELQTYYTDPSVAVNIVQVSNQKVFVPGEVNNPSVLQIENELSVLEALTRTGGISNDANTENVLLIRGGLENPTLYTVNVQGILAGDLSQNVLLQRGDVLMVPTSTIVEVERFFRRVSGMLSPVVSGSAIYRNINGQGAQSAPSQ